VTRAQTWLALAGLLAISFLGLARDLWTPDEPREAEIGREMWLAPTIVPRLNGERFIEKPPLYYWTVAAAYGLLGGPSAAAARAVSAAAAFGTLVLVFFWGSRVFSPIVGLAAAVGLATSAQFMWTSHWIVMDSLLMLFTIAALWSAHELVRGGASRNALLVFYLGVLAALWTKGLIGPVLIAVGLLAYAAARRSFAVLKPLHPFMGAAFVLLMTAALAGAIAAESGWGAVREWLWVNHVERVTNPVDTGHDQPVLYYLWTLPTAVFPWWLPFAALFRPRMWTRDPTPWHGDKLFLAAVSLGMVLLLSVPATKRGLYLMPVLPPLMLLLAAVAAEWWASGAAQQLRGAAWLAQSALVALFAVAPVAAALVYLRVVDSHAVSFLVAVAVLLVSLVVFSLRDERAKALATLATCSIASAVGLLTIAVPLAAPRKDLTPFVAWVGSQLPPRETLYVTGEIDETLDGIVPFVTGRPAVAIGAAEIDATRPRFVLVQGKNGARTAAALAAPYRLLANSEVGTDRYLALWSRDDETHGAAPQHDQSSSSEP
jgi:4-amino-4-deoxy-L-arabinose transferase-like glycosyltransferase